MLPRMLFLAARDGAGQNSSGPDRSLHHGLAVLVRRLRET
jgi:hypothetical protein